MAVFWICFVVVDCACAAGAASAEVPAKAYQVRNRLNEKCAKQHTLPPTLCLSAYLTRRDPSTYEKKKKIRINFSRSWKWVCHAERTQINAMEKASKANGTTNKRSGENICCANRLNLLPMPFTYKWAPTPGTQRGASCGGYTPTNGCHRNNERNSGAQARHSCRFLLSLYSQCELCSAVITLNSKLGPVDRPSSHRLYRPHRCRHRRDTE